MLKLKRINLLLGLTMGSMALAHAAGTSTYNNMFISYVDPSDVQATVKYANSLGIHNFFFWTYSGDVGYNNNASLIQAINNTDSQANISGYWADWEMYNTGNAIPTPAYSLVNNSDLTTKLQHSNTLVYAFLEAQVSHYNNGYRNISNYTNPFISPNEFGSLYFFDPYSDFAANLNNTTTANFCVNNVPAGLPTTTLDPQYPGKAVNLICDYVPMIINKFNNNNAYSLKDFADLGNFDNGLASLSTIGRDGQPVQKVISVGGYGHNDTFEEVFNPPSNLGITQTQAMTNFVNSAKAIMDAYNINGIDLDYEDPAMTLQQSDDYLKLIQMLSQALANDNNKYITIAILANPQYIMGTEQNGTIGFDPNYQGNGSVLKQIAALPNVKLIDLMTYDFHGRWDYNPSNPNSGLATNETGFLSNLYDPNDTSVNQLFWLASDSTDPNPIHSTLGAINSVLGSYNKVGIGFPAYGRSFANVTPGSNGTGLFSTLTSNTIVPGGDIDPAGCNESITSTDGSLCNGMFSYKYIVNYMLNNGFTPTDEKDDAGNLANGTTAFASTWSPVIPSGPSLTFVITGAAEDLTVINSSASFSTNSWITGTQTYPDSSTNPPHAAPTAVQGQNDLEVQFTNYGGSGTCMNATNPSQPFTFNLTANTTINVTSGSPVTNVTCSLGTSSK
jgi:GH18 family chitinase